jgi:hypothetical protein
MSEKGELWQVFAEFLRSRPESIQALAREWPPFTVVRAREGEVLLVPAPGVEGTVESYYEGGELGIVAPLAIPHPVYGWKGLKPGELAQAQVRPDQLVFVREQTWTRADVALALDGP